MRALRSTFTLLCLFGWVLIMAPLQVVMLTVAPRHRYVLPQLFHSGLCRLFRVKLVIHGTPSQKHPTLFVFNHISWLDIPVIGKALKGSFVAKKEVAGYPAIGWLAKLQQTIFIARTRPAVKNHKDDMQIHLEQGDSIFLFPEGTSSNGIVLQNFKSAYFALAEGHNGDMPLTVQPVTLAFSQMDNLMMTRSTMGIVAWVGDEELISHVWQFLNAGRVTAELRFHEPVTIDQYASRKEMARDCQNTVSEGLARALTGRPEKQ
ncbi:lysophospholipid acyltransferase family protein [Sneathiella chinensis]|uniref:1-acyl-sn-glycerol-3-phosphate acyltransferase n=1 Tax=Sneathiella chinensis TaxID=349750 RepID=A0ABQ5U1Q0_9PROT|nr:lysophospholipid acyltransferase family protein [Sneathiella chinensis]GLQ05208.1 1-acyl-sn-glycerol-3-phosphate acyltransferase [Sneathiella chinensis]